MPACAVRPAVQADAHAIFNVHMAAIQTLGASHYGAAQLAAWRGDRSAVSYALPIANDAIVVAVDAESVVGFGQLDVGQAVVEAVYVLPGHARLGIGRQLLATLERRAAGAGHTRLTLDASLNAQAFYEACGYRPVEHCAHELRPGVFLPCVRMAKPIRRSEDA